MPSVPSTSTGFHASLRRAISRRRYGQANGNSRSNARLQRQKASATGGIKSRAPRPTIECPRPKQRREFQQQVGSFPDPTNRKDKNERPLRRASGLWQDQGCSELGCETSVEGHLSCCLSFCRMHLCAGKQRIEIFSTDVEAFVHIFKCGINVCKMQA